MGIFDIFRRSGNGFFGERGTLCWGSGATRHTRKFLSSHPSMIYYMWLIFWMSLIFFFSTDAGSFSNTAYYIEPLLRFFFPHITPRGILLAHRLIRRLAHLTEYAVLSYLWFTALNQRRQGWSPKRALLALTLSILYALSDEYHQAFIPSRTASLTDVGIDSTGALMGQAYLFLTLRRTREEPM